MSLSPFSSPPPRREPLTFREARDRLLELSDDYYGARAAFSWPRPHEFNWALEWFDAELAAGEHGRKVALKIIGERVETRTFADLRLELSRLANGLRSLGAKRGDRLLMMLGVVPELWATMLASMKLGLVLIPAMPTLGQADIADRIERGQAKYLVAHGSDADKFAGLAEGVTRIAVGPAPHSWRRYATLLGSEVFAPDGPTKADDPMLLYFTSGTTARSKLVVHTHASYPIGHLSTMYGLGIRPGDTHLNISSPGWAKHAWSSVFAPWNAGATIVALALRFEPRAALDALVEHQVTVFCAPPTVWRMLIQHDLRQWKVVLREVNAAGEPVNPEIIEQVRRAWGLPLARFLRADRDHDDDRQFARTAGRPRFDGAAFAGLPGRAPRRRRARERHGRDRNSFASAHRGPHVRLSERTRAAHAHRRRILQDRRRRLARRGRRHHVHRPGRRRIQIERLSPKPVRTGKRADRTSGDCRGRCRAGA